MLKVSLNGSVSDEAIPQCRIGDLPILPMHSNCMLALTWSSGVSMDVLVSLPMTTLYDCLGYKPQLVSLYGHS